MSGRTISAYADEATALRLVEMARAEDRKPSAIAAAALRFYLGLPEEARSALRWIEAANTPTLSDQVKDAVTRALIDAAYDAAARRLMEQMPPQSFDSELELLDEGVRLTTTAG